MKRFFYSRLAAVNLRNNRSTYLPYLLTCSCAVITFYTMYALSLNPGLSALPGSSDITIILGLGTWVIGIFSVVLMLYTNSFLMKRRKKELGLYSILGMEKRHIARVFFQETLMIAAVCIVAGLTGGILLGKLLFLILLMALRVDTPMVFIIPSQAVSGTVIFFSLIFLVILLFNLLQIHLANPIALLHGSREGEKEPKSSWLLTITGLLALGTGYGIAVSVQSPMQAILLFFAAVLLVITGTYALFTSGSIAILKLLRKKKSFYYKPDHFIAVSGMIYRMKQNAAGLSSICILSTMVLITVSTTVSLYIGAEDSLRFRYPQEIFISCHDNENVGALHAILEGMPSIPGAVPEKPAEYRTMIVNGKLENGAFSLPANSEFGFETNQNLFLIPLEDYNQMEGTAETLARDEILIYTDGPDYGLDSLQIGESSYRVKKELSALRTAPKGLGDITTSYYVFLPDIDSVSSLGASLNLNLETPLYRRIVFDVNGSRQAVMQYAAALQEKLHSLPDYSPFFQSRSLNRDEWFSTYGGFLFLGIFLGLLFLMATVLIIYYKQISEGYDDRERFVIMQKVGMGQREIRRAIGQQIRMVFFLPPVFAAIHVTFAFSIICKLLLPFGLDNTRLYFICIVSTFLVFAAAYMLVYRLTAKTYYKLVR